MHRIAAVLLAIAAVALAGAPALAQVGPCGQQVLRGVWCLSCSGFADLSNLDPKAPKGTLVPFAGLGRETIDSDGKATGKAVFNIAGTMLAIEMDAKFTINSDCTGEKTFTLKAKDLGISIPGKAPAVYQPDGQQFQILLGPGDVVTCVYKKMFNTLLTM